MATQERRQYNRERYLANMDAVKARAAAWRKANPERQAELHARWIAENIERRREIARLSYHRRKALKANEQAQTQTQT
jgi:hypothetical protein